MFNKIILSALVLMSGLASAERVGENCRMSNAQVGGLWVSRFFTVAAGCIVNVTPKEHPNLLYREYYFDERGGFTVFNSTPGEDYETSTSKRSYFIFPRATIPSYAIEDERVIIMAPWGRSVSYSSETFRTVSMEAAEFEESDTIDLSEGGGFEIRASEGVLILEAGWIIGGTAYRDPRRSSVFRDGRGASCEVLNAEIFDYKNAIYDEPILKFQSDLTLAAYLADRCPSLDLSMLSAR